PQRRAAADTAHISVGVTTILAAIRLMVVSGRRGRAVVLRLGGGGGGVVELIAQPVDLVLGGEHLQDLAGLRLDGQLDMRPDPGREDPGQDLDGAHTTVSSAAMRPTATAGPQVEIQSRG